MQSRGNGGSSTRYPGIRESPRCSALSYAAAMCTTRGNVNKSWFTAGVRNPKLCSGVKGGTRVAAGTVYIKTGRGICDGGEVHFITRAQGEIARSARRAARQAPEKPKANPTAKRISVPGPSSVEATQTSTSRGAAVPEIKHKQVDGVLSFTTLTGPWRHLWDPGRTGALLPRSPHHTQATAQGSRTSLFLLQCPHADSRARTRRARRRLLSKSSARRSRDVCMERRLPTTACDLSCCYLTSSRGVVVAHRRACY